MDAVLKLKQVEGAYMITGTLATAGDISIDADTEDQTIELLFLMIDEDVAAGRLSRGLRILVKSNTDSFVVST